MKTKRIILDAAMISLMPLMMAYSLIGETFHEISGTAMLILFLLHHKLNRSWMRNIRKGKYNPQRAFRTALDLVLLIFLFAQPVCGILMSKHLYTFLPLPDLSAVVRAIHLPLANWGFVLICIHAGSHLGIVLKNRTKAGIITAILSAVSVYGAYAFVKRQIPQYMFLKTGFVFFDYSEPILLFLLDYLTVMLLFVMIGYGVDRLLREHIRKN
jgi:cytochrome b561